MFDPDQVGQDGRGLGTGRDPPAVHAHCPDVPNADQSHAPVASATRRPGAGARPAPSGRRASPCPLRTSEPRRKPGRTAGIRTGRPATVQVRVVRDRTAAHRVRPWSPATPGPPGTQGILPRWPWRRAGGAVRCGWPASRRAVALRRWAARPPGRRVRPPGGEAGPPTGERRRAAARPRRPQGRRAEGGAVPVHGGQPVPAGLRGVLAGGADGAAGVEPGPPVRRGAAGARRPSGPTAGGPLPRAGRAPAAAASLGQVHRGTGGTTVARSPSRSSTRGSSTPSRPTCGRSRRSPAGDLARGARPGRPAGHGRAAHAPRGGTRLPGRGAAQRRLRHAYDGRPRRRRPGRCRRDAPGPGVGPGWTRRPWSRRPARPGRPQQRRDSLPDLRAVVRPTGGPAARRPPPGQLPAYSPTAGWGCSTSGPSCRCPAACRPRSVAWSGRSPTSRRPASSAASLRRGRAGPTRPPLDVVSLGRSWRRSANRPATRSSPTPRSGCGPASTATPRPGTPTTPWGSVSRLPADQLMTQRVWLGSSARCAGCEATVPVRPVLRQHLPGFGP